MARKPYHLFRNLNQPKRRNTMNDSSFLILFIALTALMAIFPFLLRKYHIPNVIALQVVGMLIG